MFVLMRIVKLILFPLFICNGQLIPKFIDGSLTEEFSFNYTFFTRFFDGPMLYLVDYDRNNLIVTVLRDPGKTIQMSVSFNKEKKDSNLKDLCGCDPCDAKMMNLRIHSAKDTFILTCNTYNYVVINKIFTKNQVNNQIPRNIRAILNDVSRNHIYVMLSHYQIGCLKSFTYNGQSVDFKQNGTKFHFQCPRNCAPSECNGGLCRPLYPKGPLCDCSNTALHGLHCNDSLIVYKPSLLNSYSKTGTNNALQIKLAWKSKIVTKKYCLLNFVHRYGHVTLSSYQNVFLKGDEVLTDINSTRINFLVVNVTENNVMITVNNKLIDARPGLFGNMTLNVGFSGNQDRCDMFEGDYNFVYNKSQLMPRNTGGQSSATMNFIRENQIALVVSGSSFVAACVLIIIVYHCMRQKHEIYQENITWPRDADSVFTEDMSSQFYGKVADSNSYDEISMGIRSKDVNGSH